MRQTWQRISPLPAEAAAARPALFIFPHAGGSRFSYAVLAKKLHGFCDVFSTEYPNLQISELTKVLTDNFLSLQTGQTYFFGHSMGALVAFESMLRLKENPSAPEALLVSACAPPGALHGPSGFQEYEGEWTEEALLQFMRSYGVLPKIFEHKEAREYFFALLAKDLKILKKYRASEGVLTQAIHGIFGEQDLVVSKDKMLGWNAYSLKKFTLQSLPGGHLYPMEQSEHLAVTLKAFMSKAD